MKTHNTIREYLFTQAFFPVYMNYLTNKYEVYSSSGVYSTTLKNKKKIFECDAESQASQFCISEYKRINK